MGLFKDIAEPLITKNVPVIPLRPKTKVAFLSNWNDIATTNQLQVDKWDEEFPEANGACVAYAKPDGVWFFEIDRPDILDTIQKETGRRMPDTFMVRSSPGRGHYYFKHTAASIEMGNAQAKDDNGELWSARADKRYVVAPGSYHPNTGKRYEIIRDIEIAPAPDWLVEWCVSQQRTEDERSPVTASIDGPKVPRGSHDTTMTRIAGKLRQDGLEEEAIYNALVEVCEKRFENYGSDYLEMARKVAKSVCRYPIKPAAGSLVLGGVQLGQPQVAPEPEILEFKPTPYPIFPRWVMKGTSLYNGLIGPVCEKNSRYPEYMFMPAVTIILNYVAIKVRVQYKNLIPSIYMVSIGRKGRVIKSSSVKDAVEYLSHAGIVSDAGPQTRNAESKSLVFTAGSPEGLGMEMQRTNCKNAILFYDELSSLTNKAGIEGSSLTSKLLEMYESSKFANTVKSRKEIFNFEQNTYCTSLIACTTDKNFLQHWSKMAGGSSGLDERFFFLYQPEVLVELKPYTQVDQQQIQDAALHTRKLIDKAVKQGLYRITDMTPLEMKINKLGNRTEIRAEKLALYFAIDLGRDEIDEECVDRAIAICEYEIAVKKYLKTFETVTREGAIQNEMIQVLQRNGGSLEKRKFEKLVHPMRYGITIYTQCYVSLIRGGYITEYGKGTRGDPQMVVLLRAVEDEEDE
jgi:hypothetical protein